MVENLASLEFKKLTGVRSRNLTVSFKFTKDGPVVATVTKILEF